MISKHSVGCYIILENNVAICAFYIMMNMIYWILRLRIKFWKNTCQTMNTDCLKGLSSNRMKKFLFYFIHGGDLWIFYSKNSFHL